MAYRDKSAQPTPNEWGNLRSKFARRGVSQEWIDTYIDKREIMWGSHDHNVRSGYLGTHDVIDPVELVSIVQLAVYLDGQGWEAEPKPGQMSVIDGTETYIVTQVFLQSCDYSSLNNPPLENDLQDGVREQGFCL